MVIVFNFSVLTKTVVSNSFRPFCEHNNIVAIQVNYVGTTTIFSYNDSQVEHQKVNRRRIHKTRENYTCANQNWALCTT